MFDEVTTYELGGVEDYGSGGGPDFGGGMDPRGDPRWANDPNGIVPQGPFQNETGPDGTWAEGPPVPPFPMDPEDDPRPVGPPVLELVPTPVPTPQPPSVGSVLNGLGAGTLLLAGVALFFLFRKRR